MILILNDGTGCQLLLQANRGGAIDLQFVSKKEEGTFLLLFNRSGYVLDFTGARKLLDKMTEKGLITKIGNGPATKYVI